MRGKKNGRATSGDRGGEPTVQVARPLLGDTRWVSGEEIVSALAEGSKDCASEKSRRIMDGELGFLLFLRRGIARSLELGRFLTKIASSASCECYAACDLGMFTLRGMHPGDCVERTALTHCAENARTHRRRWRTLPMESTMRLSTTISRTRRSVA